MKIMLTKKNNKGVALLWTLIICLVLLIVTGTMVGYIVKDSQASLRIEDSVQAYAAAKSGLDWAAWYTNPENNMVDNGDSWSVAAPLTKTHILNAAPNVTFTVTIDGTIGGSLVTINSTGVVNGVQRKLRYEIVQAPNPPVLLSANGVINPPAAGNFELSFDFWTSLTISNFKFGVQDSSQAAPTLAMSVVNGCAYLVSEYPGPSIVSGKCIDINGINSEEPYVLKTKVQYVEGLYANLQILSRDWSSTTEEDFTSLGSVSIPLVGVNIGTINQLYLGGGSYIVQAAPPYIGDGTFWQINSVDPNYVDNPAIAR